MCGRWFSTNSNSLYSYPCVSTPLECDLLLIGRVWQRWWGIMSMNGLYRGVISISLANSSPCWLWWSKLPCCELLYGEEHMEGLTPAKEMKSSVWQSPKNWILPITIWPWKWILPQLAFLMRSWFQPCRRPW